MKRAVKISLNGTATRHAAAASLGTAPEAALLC